MGRTSIMDKSKIKYFYFDLDGTLLDNNKELSSRVLKSLEQLKKIGYKVGIATGRPDYMIKQELDLIMPNLPTIAINGAKIIDNQKILQLHFIEVIEIQKLYDFLIQNQITFLGYTNDNMYYYLPASKSSQQINWLKQTINTRPPKHKWELLPFSNNSIKFCKILVIISESSKEIQNKFNDFIKEFNNIDAVKSQIEVLDIMPKNVSKGNALVFIDSKNIIDLQETIVFGDAENDVSMFEEAAFSVAMKNADDYVKSKASFINKFSNNEDGVAQFIEKNFF